MRLRRYIKQIGMVALLAGTPGLAHAGGTTWGFDWLLTFVNAFWTTVVTVITWLVNGILYALEYCVYFVLDGVFTSIVAFINLIDVSALITDAAVAWGLIPTQLAYFIIAVNIPQGIAIIVVGYGIRMSLNLIPSWITRI
jgi:hypothetical protein